MRKSLRQTSRDRTAAVRGPLPPGGAASARKAADARRIVAFLFLFVIVFAILFRLLDGTGPLRSFNRAIGSLTQFQASLAAAALRVLGERTSDVGSTIQGPAFACTVESGCNGMDAVSLVVAAVLAFPVPWRRRGLGLAILVPAVLVVNVVRIAGLYWTGAHVPSWFGAAHVYGGQVLVIAVTFALWWTWLSWSFRAHAESSSS